MSKMRLPITWLEAHGACEEQVQLAALYWGESIPITRRTCREAAALGLHLGWLADRLLPAEAWTRYDAEMAEPLTRYRAQTARAQARYRAATAEALWRALRSMSAADLARRIGGAA